MPSSCPSCLLSRFLLLSSLVSQLPSLSLFSSSEFWLCISTLLSLSFLIIWVDVRLALTIQILIILTIKSSNRHLQRSIPILYLLLLFQQHLSPPCDVVDIEEAPVLYPRQALLLQSAKRDLAYYQALVQSETSKGLVAGVWVVTMKHGLP